MTCKYFREDTDSCTASRANSFLVWFQPDPDLDFRALDALWEVREEVQDRLGFETILVNDWTVEFREAA